MEPKRLTARAMLQRMLTLTKHARDFQLSSNLTNPIGNNHWQSPSSITLDLTQGLTATAINQSQQALPHPIGLHRKFDFSRAQKLLQLELDRRCACISKSLRYDPKKCRDLVQDLTENLRRIIKPDGLNSVRYKIIVIVTIVQTIPDRQTHQSMTIVSRCLWDHETDGSITAQATLGYDMLAIATIFAVYTD